MSITITGKLFDIGEFADVIGEKIGVRIDADGRIVEVTGLTQDQCRDLSKHFGDIVTIQIGATE